MDGPQRTLERPVEMEGIGIFFGKPVRLRVLPAAPDSGFSFVRTDLPQRPRVAASVEGATTRLHHTALSEGDVDVETVEHFLAAARGLGIDNLEIEIDTPELPGCDGSAARFVEFLREGGIREQDRPRTPVRLRDAVHVREDEASLVALPAEQGLSISYTLDYRPRIPRPQHFTLALDEETFCREIAPARTFAFRNEIQLLLDQGIGKGATPESTVIVGPGGTEEKDLRFPDEIVRHKILDLIGDLALLRRPLCAHVVGVRSGHTLNLQLVRRLLDHSAAVPTRREPWLDVREILKILPHRYPFLLVDRVIELDGYRRAVGIKNVTYNEPFFAGHFPGRPIMPGVLQIEAMAQLAGALLLRRSENAGKLAVLLSLDNVKLRRAVVPGDQLRIEAEAVRVKARTGLVHARCTVDGEVTAEGMIKFMLVDSEMEIS